MQVDYFYVPRLLFLQAIVSSVYARYYGNSSSSADSRGYGPQRYPKSPGYGPHPGRQHHQRKCGIPNVVQGQTVIPKKMLGTWYKYLSVGGSTGPQPIGWTNQYVGLGETVLPGTEIRAEAVALSLYSYDTFHVDGKCRGYFAQSYFAVNGLEIGISYDTTAGPKPFPDAEFVLYNDYHTCEVVYLCGKVNLQTGICALPRFYVNTRIRLDLMTPQQKKVVDDIADRVLNPYYFGVEDLVADIWGPQYAEPCIVAPPPCFVNLIDGIKATL